jgi:hypothetical protein
MSKSTIRRLSVESLEFRKLMASAFLQGDQLMINGSEGSDDVRLIVYNSGATRVFSGKQTILEVDRSKFSSIDAAMRGGQDSLQITAQNHHSLISVSVNMGSGSGESLDLDIGYADNVRIDATKSNRSKVEVSGEIDQLMILLGAGDDELILSNANVVKLETKAGKGNDKILFKDSEITTARIQMGNGRDRIYVDSDSEIDNGTIDGGKGDNLFRKSGAKLSREVKLIRLGK